MWPLIGKLVLLALGLVVLAFVLLLLYVRWFARAVGADLPYVEVQTLPGPEKGVARVRLTLRATTRKFQLLRFWAERDDVERLGIVIPDGFVPEKDHEASETVESWVPRERFTLKPRQPVELELRYELPGQPPASVHGWAEAALGLGGTILPFSVVVGDRDPLEIELSNRRSRLYARAREKGVAPKELPGFEELRTLEAELERAKGHSRGRATGSGGEAE